MQNGTTSNVSSVWGGAGNTAKRPPLGNVSTMQSHPPSQQQVHHQQHSHHHPSLHTAAQVASATASSGSASGHMNVPGSTTTGTSQSVWSSSHRISSTHPLHPPSSTSSTTSVSSPVVEPLFPPLTSHSSAVAAATPVLTSYSTLAKKTMEAIDESDFPPLSEVHATSAPMPPPAASSLAPLAPLASNVAVGHSTTRVDRHHASHIRGSNNNNSSHSQTDAYFPSMSHTTTTTTTTITTTTTTSGNSGSLGAGQRKSSGLVQPPSGVSAAQPTSPGHSHRPDFALMGLLDVIRMTDPDLTTLALGMDLASLGLDLTSGEPLYMSFVSPWGDAHTRISQLIPPCYQMPQLPPPLLQRLSQISEDALLYLFYSLPLNPSDKELSRFVEVQEAAAKELSRRGWRWHREIHQWLLKDTLSSTTAATAAAVASPATATATATTTTTTTGASVGGATSLPGSQPSLKSQNTATAAPLSLYIVFDPTRMEKAKRELLIPSDHLISFWDERSSAPPVSKAPESNPNTK